MATAGQLADRQAQARALRRADKGVLALLEGFQEPRHVGRIDAFAVVLDGDLPRPSWQ
jgi:hypothetical protein